MLGELPAAAAQFFLGGEEVRHRMSCEPSRGINGVFFFPPAMNLGRAQPPSSPTAAAFLLAQLIGAERLTMFFPGFSLSSSSKRRWVFSHFPPLHSAISRKDYITTLLNPSSFSSRRVYTRGCTRT